MAAAIFPLTAAASIMPGARARMRTASCRTRRPAISRKSISTPSCSRPTSSPSWCDSTAPITSSWERTIPSTWPTTIRSATSPQREASTLRPSLPSPAAMRASYWGYRCRSTQILADKILDRANRIFGATGTRLAFRGFPFCRDLGLFLFRRLFRDHHGPEPLVAGLLVVGDGNPDNVGLGLQQVRVVAWRGLPHVERLRPCLGASRYVFGRHARTRAGHPCGE